MCYYGRRALLLPSCLRSAHTIHSYKNHLDINLSMTLIFLFEFSQYFDKFPGCSLKPGNRCTRLQKYGEIHFRNINVFHKKKKKKQKYYQSQLFLSQI